MHESDLECLNGKRICHITWSNLFPSHVFFWIFSRSSNVINGQWRINNNITINWTFWLCLLASQKRSSNWRSVCFKSNVEDISSLYHRSGDVNVNTKAMPQHWLFLINNLYFFKPIANIFQHLITQKACVDDWRINHITFSQLLISSEL